MKDKATCDQQASNTSQPDETITRGDLEKAGPLHSRHSSRGPATPLRSSQHTHVSACHDSLEQTPSQTGGPSRSQGKEAEASPEVPGVSAEEGILETWSGICVPRAAHNRVQGTLPVEGGCAANTTWTELRDSTACILHSRCLLPSGLSVPGEADRSNKRPVCFLSHSVIMLCACGSCWQGCTGLGFCVFLRTDPALVTKGPLPQCCPVRVQDSDTGAHLFCGSCP